VAHGDTFASMLQLTRSDQGQITGVLDALDLRPDGKLHSDHAAIIGGALDGDQLTLTVNLSSSATTLAALWDGEGSSCMSWPAMARSFPWTSAGAPRRISKSTPTN
jgi:hypothetical protein